MPYPDEHMARLRDPADFLPGTFGRSRGISELLNGRDLFLIEGRLKSTGEKAWQGVRYPINIWPELDARKDAKYSNAISFEPATGKGKNNECE